MSIARTRTKLPLATFASIMGVHPLHFAQVASPPSNNRTSTVCDMAALFQEDWQASDRVGREQMARAIQEAENMIERYLGCRLTPTWETDEWRPGPRAFRPEWRGSLRDIRGLPVTIQTKQRPFITGGIERKTAVTLGAPITWSDGDNDGYSETGTVTVTVADGQDGCEIEAFYPGEGGADEFQIRPARVAVAGTTATITFRRELAVLKELLYVLEPRAADPLDDDDFLDTVDIYRRYNDPSQQVTLLWSGARCIQCAGAGCGACTMASATGCLVPAGVPNTGLVGIVPATWDSENARFVDGCFPADAPNLVKLYYRAGLAGSTCGEMPSEWARAVSYLAVSFIDRPLCGCNEDVWEFWREDLAEKGTKGDALYASAITKNPFGTRRGAAFAWNRVADLGVAVVGATSLV